MLTPVYTSHRDLASLAIHHQICLTRNDGWCIHDISLVSTLSSSSYVCRASHTEQEPPKTAEIVPSISTIPGLPLTPVSEVYNNKDRPDIKSPELPFGENVSIATGTVGAQ